VPHCAGATRAAGRPLRYRRAVVGIISLVAMIVLVARRRVSRAWGWWIASIVALLVSAWTLWGLPVLIGLQLALLIDAIRIEIRARRHPAAAAPTAGRGRRWLHLVAMIVAGGALTLGLRMFVVESYRIPSAGMEPTLVSGDHTMADKLALHFRDPRPGDLLVFRNPCQPRLSFIKRVVAVGGDTVEVRCNQLYRNGAPVPTVPVPGACSYIDEDEHGVQNPVECVRRRETWDQTTGDIVLGAGASFDAPADHDFPDPLATAADYFVCMSGQRPPVAGEIVATPGPETAAACSPRAHYVVPAGQVFVLGDNRHNSSDSRTWGPVPLDHAIGILDRIWWPGQTGGFRWDRLGAVH
jgi:signal peptidase I